MGFSFLICPEAPCGPKAPCDPKAPLVLSFSLLSKSSENAEAEYLSDCSNHCGFVSLKKNKSFALRYSEICYDEEI